MTTSIRITDIDGKNEDYLPTGIKFEGSQFVVRLEKGEPLIVDVPDGKGISYDVKQPGSYVDADGVLFVVQRGFRPMFFNPPGLRVLNQCEFDRHFYENKDEQRQPFDLNAAVYETWLKRNQAETKSRDVASE